jgi:hypothetical protein
MECIDVRSLTPINLTVIAPAVFLKYVYKHLRLKKKKLTGGYISRHPSLMHAIQYTSGTVESV